jgi:NAD(P)-dependent dehydrogenase (short-subunit alcohol dehydrogenase family)
VRVVTESLSIDILILWRNRYKTLNVLVNNASKQYSCKDLVDIDLDNVEDTFQSNIIQMFAITKFALLHMSKGDSYVSLNCCFQYPSSNNHFSRIINNTSVVAFRGTAGMVDYAASKGAIVGFTRALAQQLMPKGIRVNAVA